MKQTCKVRLSRRRLVRDRLWDSIGAEVPVKVGPFVGKGTITRCDVALVAGARRMVEIEFLGPVTLLLNADPVKRRLR